MKRWLIIGAVFAALVLLATIGFQAVAIHKLKQERNRYQRNTEALLTDIETYKTRDSLNAAQIGALQLTVGEYKRYRAEDAELIKSLKARNKDLAAVTTMQMQTILELSAAPKDTVIIRDSIRVDAIALHTGDSWYDFDGLLTDKAFSGTVSVRESLLIAETVQYKRFWGFLWKTKQVKSRKIDVVSRNPHTTITKCEHVIIEK